MKPVHQSWKKVTLILLGVFALGLVLGFSRLGNVDWSLFLSYELWLGLVFAWAIAMAGVFFQTEKTEISSTTETREALKGPLLSRTRIINVLVFIGLLLAVYFVITLR